MRVSYNKSFEFPVENNCTNCARAVIEDDSWSKDVYDNREELLEELRK